MNRFLTLIIGISLMVSTLFLNSCLAFEEQPASNEEYLPDQTEEYIADQIIVKFKPGTQNEAIDQLNQSLGTTVIHTSPSAGFKVLQIPEGKTVAEMVAAYSEQPIVEYAEPNYIDRLLPETGQNKLQ